MMSNSGSPMRPMGVLLRFLTDQERQQLKKPGLRGNRDRFVPIRAVLARLVNAETESIVPLPDTRSLGWAPFSRVSRIAGFLMMALLWASAKTDGTVQFASGVNLVEVYATVSDARGRPIGGLEARDFAVDEDGKPQP